MANVPVRVDRRAERKHEVSRRIRDVALRMFLDQGYEATTVEDVAAATGVSHMTVFRHFPTKASLVFSDESDALIADAIRKRPPTESALTSVERAVIEVVGRLSQMEQDLQVQRFRLIWSTPTLQAELWVRWMAAQRLVAGALVDRGGAPADPLALHVVAGIAYVTAATASLAWIEEVGRRPLTELLSEAFAAARGQLESPTDGATPVEPRG